MAFCPSHFEHTPTTTMATKLIVLISGGNGGIGYEIVQKLAVEHQETHHILMGTRNLERGHSAYEAMGSLANVTPIQLDITQDSSIDSAVEQIESTYGRLDVLINNAATAGRDLGVRVDTGALPPGMSLREIYEKVYQLNVISTAVLTDKMIPLLEKSSLPKIIFISSILGSAGALQSGFALRPLPWYSSSKAAVNHLCIWYSRKYPKWKINACCPGHLATGLNFLAKNEQTDPKNGAINACRLVLEHEDGRTGTFSNQFEDLPW